MNDKFEYIIKDKLDDFQFVYNKRSWKKLKNDLPAKVGFSVYYILTFLVSAGIIATILLYQNNANDRIFQADRTNQGVKNLHLAREAYEYTGGESKSIGSLIQVDIQLNESSVLEKNLLEQPVVENRISENSEVKSNLNILDKRNPEKKPNSLFEVVYADNCQPVTAQFIPFELSDTIIYLWEFGDGQFSNKKKPVHIYENVGEYIIKLSVKYFHSEKVYSNTKRIEVRDKPVADFENTLDHNKITFMNYSQNAVAYEWNFSLPDLNTSEFEPIVYFESEGNYLVSLKAMHKNGCYDKLEKLVKVNYTSTLFFPDAFSPNADGRNDLFEQKGVGLENVDFTMNIIDKFGNTVFASNDINSFWDGIIMGTTKKAEEGTYSWQYILKYKSGKTIKDKGRVRLIRN